MRVSNDFLSGSAVSLRPARAAGISYPSYAVPMIRGTWRSLLSLKMRVGSDAAWTQRVNARGSWDLPHDDRVASSIPLDSSAQSPITYVGVRDGLWS